MINSISRMLEERKWLCIYILAGIALLFMSFAPAINFSYYAGDDFRYTFGNPDLTCRRDEGYYFMMTLGRPLQAYLDCLSFRYAYTVERMHDVRVFTVLMMGCGLGLIADTLRQYGVSILHAFLIAAALTLLPHYYADVVFMGAFSLPVATLLAIFAYRCMAKSHHPQTSNFVVVCLRFVAVVSLIFAALSYPASMFIYMTLVLLKVLLLPFKEWLRVRREVIIDVLIFVTACGIYFIYAYYNMTYHSRAPIAEPYQLVHPNFKPVEILNRLLILLNVFNPFVWAILPMQAISTQGQAIIALLTCGILASVISNLRHLHIAKWCQAMVMVVGVLLLCSTFSLITPRLNLDSRLLIGTISASIALLVWSLYQCSNVFPQMMRTAIVSTVLLSYIAIQCYQGNLYMMRGAARFALYLSSQSEIVKSFLVHHSLKRIHFVVEKGEYPMTRYFFTGGILAGIYGHDQYQLEWCAASRDGSKSEMDNVRQTLECIHSQPKGTIAVTYSFVGDAYPVTKDMLVMNGGLEQQGLGTLIRI